MCVWKIVFDNSNYTFDNLSEVVSISKMKKKTFEPLNSMDFAAIFCVATQSEPKKNTQNSTKLCAIEEERKNASKIDRENVRN